MHLRGSSARGQPALSTERAFIAQHLHAAGVFRYDAQRTADKVVLVDGGELSEVAKVWRSLGRIVVQGIVPKIVHWFEDGTLTMRH